MRIAVMTTVLPSPRRTGGEVATQAVVDAMRRAGHDVTVVGYLRPGAEVGDGEVAVAVRTIESEDAGLVERLGWAATAAVVALPLSAAKYAGAGYAKAAREVMADADAVVIDRAQAGWWLRGSDVLPPMALLVQNVEAGVYWDQLHQASGPKRLALRREHRLVHALEQRLVERAADVWTYTEQEREHFGRGRVLPLPAAVADAGARTATRDVALLGTWTWGPNAVGLRWFADHVLPLLATRDVHVAGAGGEWIAERGVTHHGKVPDAAAFLDSARVVAIPSIAGRGIQIKTLDALATGAWVVSTSVALRGLDAAPPAVRIEDDPARFAAAVDELVADPGTLERNPAALAWSAPRQARLDATIADALHALGRDTNERTG